MDAVLSVRNYSKVGDMLEIPSLVGVQRDSYARFLQEDLSPGVRAPHGLEALLREMFPIESYDGNLSLHYKIGRAHV